MTTRRTLTLLAAAGGMLLAAGLAAGCHRGPGGHPRDPAAVAKFVTGRVDAALDDVDATPGQREKIHAIEDRLLAEGQKLHADREKLHPELLAMWKGDAVDRARLHALVDERIDALRAFAHAAADGAADAHDALTPAQRERLAKRFEGHGR